MLDMASIWPAEHKSLDPTASIWTGLTDMALKTHMNIWVFVPMLLTSRCHPFYGSTVYFACFICWCIIFRHFWLIQEPQEPRIVTISPSTPCISPHVRQNHAQPPKWWPFATTNSQDNVQAHHHLTLTWSNPHAPPWLIHISHTNIGTNCCHVHNLGTSRTWNLPRDSISVAISWQQPMEWLWSSGEDAGTCEVGFLIFSSLNVHWFLDIFSTIQYSLMTTSDNNHWLQWWP